MLIAAGVNGRREGPGHGLFERRQLTEPGSSGSSTIESSAFDHAYICTYVYNTYMLLPSRAHPHALMTPAYLTRALRAGTDDWGRRDHAVIGIDQATQDKEAHCSKQRPVLSAKLSRKRQRLGLR